MYHIHVLVKVYIHVHVHVKYIIWRLTDVMKASEIDPTTMFPSIPPTWVTPEQAAALSFDFSDTSVK